MVLFNYLSSEQLSMMDEPTHMPNQSLIDEPLLLLPEIVPNTQLNNGQPEDTQLDSGIDSRVRATRSVAATTPLERNIIPTTESVNYYELGQQGLVNNEQHTRSVSVRFQEPLVETQRDSHPPFHSTGAFGQTGNVGPSSDRTYYMPSRVQDFSQRANSTMDFSTQLRHLQLSPSHSGWDMSRQNLDSYGRWDIHRWGLRYDGQSSVTNFLERIEELRISRGVPKEKLLQSAVELFERDALLWYRINDFASWEDLVEKLKEAFQPYDYENSLWDEIRRRTQGAQERVISYVSVMENLFRKLNVRPAESERLQIIRRNMLPYIQTQMALHQVQTINDLLRTARVIEETEFRIQKFLPPPTITRNLMEPELAYRKVTTRDTHAAPVTTEVTRNGDGTSRPVLCWNCGEHDHKFRRCKKPKKIFCFKCGKSEVTSTSCPTCQKNGRATRQ